MQMFLKAKPIWIKDKEREVNCRVQFKAICPKANNTEMHIATSGIYQLWINGKFVSYGPARAGKNHFRMDRLDVSRYLTAEQNTVVVEVAGYYCSNFYIMRQDSFLQAEIVSGDTALVSTGEDFTARINPYYIRKIQRYCGQRTFAEGYRLTDPDDSFFTDASKGNEELAVTEPKTIIERTVPYPEYERIEAQPLFSGTAERVVPETYTYNSYFLKVGFKEGEATGWKADELDCAPEKDWQELCFSPCDSVLSDSLGADSYHIYRFSHNTTGMLNVTVNCEKPVSLYLAFDEVMNGSTLKPTRLQVCNIIRLDLAAGRHSFLSFEVYTMKYLQLVAMNGGCKIEDIKLIEYKAPPIKTPLYEEIALQKIADAAVETYRQNAVDIFTDCPSRERAGWLCDSFFLARTEHVLTGNNTVEEAFLENFLHEDVYGKVPRGMFPMCYPADHRFGRYIPNWAMWLVVELLDYKKRTGKTELIERFKKKVYGLIEFFQDFENSDGLLEDLKSWVFVEWSRANDPDMVQGINYPSNMMYYAMLSAAAELYGDDALKAKAENVKKKINDQSFDGTFYVDRAVRTNDGIFPVSESTEVCQYYAFFSGVATPESHPKLFRRLVEEFGPDRDMMKTYPKVHKAAPFIGNYLRLEILMNYGYKETVLENIKGYFLYMAERTGTLWEAADPTEKSCNHGFASCVLYWMK